MSSSRRPAFVTSLAALVGAGVALTVHHAVRADGAPTMSPLLYRGYLERGGVPDDTSRMVGASLWDRATDGARLCDVPAAPVTPSGGRFELPLDACVAAVRANREAWLQLSVDGTALPRTKLGAVPYALEADRASGAAGGLETRIAAMQTQLTALAAQNTALQARVAATEERADPDCPPGYTRDATAPFDDAGGNLRRLCRKALPDGTSDEVVRVGALPNVFWVDRFEASVIAASSPYGRAFEADAEPAGLPRNGQWRVESLTTTSPLTAPYLARSARGVVPARWVTWFQASELCRMTGKRLPTGDEWLAAAMGTYDPGDNDGSRDDRCNTGNGAGGASPAAPRAAGGGNGCRSHWGAQDMVGNVWEWTAEWFAGAGNGVPPGGFVYDDGTREWPTGYGSDRTFNVNSYVATGYGNAIGVPSAAFRGGYWIDGTRAGVYSLGLDSGPSNWNSNVGFRCVLRR